MRQRLGVIRMATSVTGTIKKIYFQREEFVVAQLDNKTKICGKLPGAEVGLKVTLYGRMENHDRYGEQLYFTGYKKHDKNDYNYLASGLVKNIRDSTAKQLIKFFDDPVDVILNHPEKLTMIKGISEQKAQEISKSVKDTIKYREIANDLAPIKPTPLLIVKIYNNFKNHEQVLKNPYILTKIDLIGFRKADKAAQNLGIPHDSIFRVKAACYYELNQSTKEGHVYLTEEELAIRVYELLNKKISPDQIEKAIADLDISREGDRLYLHNLLEAENNAANFFTNRDLYIENRYEKQIKDFINNYEITLSDKQKEAVKLSLSKSVLIITGGPGTGKTETIKAITKIHKELFHNPKIILAAPTGRASRRMEEVTGLKAQTIHRLIQSTRNTKRNKLNADVLIIDEMSMVDIELFSELLSLIGDTKLIFVGDADQLPSVGPGQVLKDLLDVLPTVRLSQVFRQAEESDIIVNAHKINRGDLDLKLGKDFYFINKETPDEILREILNYSKKFHKEKGSLHGLQLISLMRKGTLGIDNLNSLIQDIAVPGKSYFRIGDRVIQTVNNYIKNVFNGDMGIVKKLDPLTVDYGDREVTYTQFETDQVTLAYAITAHKSQGSEFPVVLMPLHEQHYIMLNRQVVYTAITRAKKLAIVVGSQRSLSMAARNILSTTRNTALKNKLEKSIKNLNNTCIFA